MPREDTARTQHNRDGLRYPSDLADREWALIAQLLPLARPVGRPRTADLRSVTDAMFHVALSGCQWWALPKDFPPVSTVRGYFSAWRNTGLWQIISHLVVMSTRELEELKATLIVTAKLNGVHPQGLARRRPHPAREPAGLEVAGTAPVDLAAARCLAAGSLAERSSC